MARAPRVCDASGGSRDEQTVDEDTRFPADNGSGWSSCATRIRRGDTRKTLGTTHGSVMTQGSCSYAADYRSERLATRTPRGHPQGTRSDAEGSGAALASAGYCSRVLRARVRGAALCARACCGCLAAGRRGKRQRDRERRCVDEKETGGGERDGGAAEKETRSTEIEARSFRP
jgi:hypothetical protein